MSSSLTLLKTTDPVVVIDRADNGHRPEPASRLQPPAHLRPRRKRNRRWERENPSRPTCTAAPTGPYLCATIRGPLLLLSLSGDLPLCLRSAAD